MGLASLVLLGSWGCAAPLVGPPPGDPGMGAESGRLRSQGMNGGDVDCARPRAGGRDDGSLARVVAVGHRLMAAPLAGAPPSRDVVFRIVNRQVPNAVAAGDQIFVTCAMMDLLGDDDELAFALGHELAHIALGHAAKDTALDREPAFDLGDAAPSPGHLLSTVRRGMSNRYNRDQERAADALGLRYAHAAGYRPGAAVTVMRRLEREVPRGVLDEFADAHPPYPERIAALQALADALNGSKPPAPR